VWPGFAKAAEKEFAVSVLQFIAEGWAKVRRYCLVHYRKKYVQEMLTLRRGECTRCGTCCTFMVRCPHLQGQNQCKVYEKRAVQCRTFPISPRDLRGRFSVCGYYFVKPAEAGQTEPARENAGHAAAGSAE